MSEDIVQIYSFIARLAKLCVASLASFVRRSFVGSRNMERAIMAFSKMQQYRPLLSNPVDEHAAFDSLIASLSGVEADAPSLEKEAELQLRQEKAVVQQWMSFERGEDSKIIIRLHEEPPKLSLPELLHVDVCVSRPFAHSASS